MATSPWNQTGVARPSAAPARRPTPRWPRAGDLVAERVDRARASRRRRWPAGRRGRSCARPAPGRRSRRLAQRDRGTPARSPAKPVRSPIAPVAARSRRRASGRPTRAGVARARSPRPRAPGSAAAAAARAPAASAAPSPPAGRTVAAGQPHGQLVAEAEGAVVPAVDRHRRDRQVGPLGELAVDESPGELLVDRHPSSFPRARRSSRAATIGRTRGTPHAQGAPGPDRPALRERRAARGGARRAGGHAGAWVMPAECRSGRDRVEPTSGASSPISATWSRSSCGRCWQHHPRHAGVARARASRSTACVGRADDPLGGSAASTTGSSTARN